MSGSLTRSDFAPRPFAVPVRRVFGGVAVVAAGTFARLVGVLLAMVDCSDDAALCARTAAMTPRA